MSIQTFKISHSHAFERPGRYIRSAEARENDNGCLPHPAAVDHDVGVERLAVRHPARRGRTTIFTC